MLSAVIRTGLSYRAVREVVKVPLEDVAGKLKMVSPDASIIREAKHLGISFGD